MQLQTMQEKIYDIRGQRVMLDFDLAELYKTETRAVRRNINRFPENFMFVLNGNEVEEVVSQFGIPSKSYFGRALPFAFTEQGVAMLSGVLKSPKAVQVNIAIMRAFVLMHQYALSHKDLTDKLKEIETKYDKNFEDVYQTINYLIGEKEQEADFNKRKRIGYKKK